MPTTIVGDQVECPLCGDWVLDTCSLDDRAVCLCCASDYPICDRCGRSTETLSETMDGDEVCANCARCHYDKCERCERLADRSYSTADGTVICEPCTMEYWDCDGCGELIDFGAYCWSCAQSDEYDDARDVDDLIKDYNFKPIFDFHGSGPLFLGLELEINAPWDDIRNCAETAIESLGELGYLKEDSSINNNTGRGFEIVTHPMSYRWAIDRFPWNMLVELGRNGCTGTGNGLHVHISRAAFESSAHVYRWMKLLHRNTEQVTTVARRVSTKWAAFNDSDRKQVKHYAKGAKGNRYQAINTQNDDTFELRIFASSLKPQEVKAALGLAAASVEYTRNLSVTDIARHDGWTWSTFVTWLWERPEYAPLLRELEDLACVC
jgi:hypothetical protein